MKKSSNRYEVINGRHVATKEYRAWDNMKSRCLNKKAKGFKHYGGRGIKISGRWLKSFEDFLFDMGKAPSKTHTLGRINNNKSYCKSNCRLETNTEQGGNKRNTVYVYYKRKKIPLADCARSIGISHQRAQYAHKIGWRMDEYEKVITRK